MRAKRWLAFLAAFIMLINLGSLLNGCSEDEGTPSGPDDGEYTVNSKADCQGCHTDEAMLKATVEPEGESISSLASNEGHGFRVPAGEG
jgi:hypothetical protein